MSTDFWRVFSHYSPWPSLWAFPQVCCPLRQQISEKFYVNSSSRLIFFLFLPIVWAKVENYSFLFNKFSKLTGFSFRFLLAGEVVNHVTNRRVPQCKTLSGCVSNGEDIFLSLLTDHMKSPNYPLKPLSSLSL